MAAVRSDAVRDLVRAHVRAGLGAAVLGDVDASASALLTSFHQGLPRPIACPDGRVAYEGPTLGAAIRRSGGWMRWRDGGWRALSAAASAEIDRLLADPAFWREPDYEAPTCTDGGAQRLVVRHAGRETVRQQGCGGSGLTGRLYALAAGAL